MNPEKEAGRAGPQGTQVFSRDQIAEFLEDDAESDGEARARLVLLTSHPGNQEAGRTLHLSADRITIGRSPVCDLCIEEPSMSSEHARLVFSDDAWRVINLLSTNGVFVNDQKVFSHRLHDGDEIRLGRARLRFRDPDSRPQRQYGFDARPWLRWAGGIVLVIAAAVVAFWLLR